MTDVVATALATPRLTGFLLGTFAAIASALAVIGLYGVLSYLVARRTHEIGIRMAMGADRAQVLGMIVRRGVALAAVGIAVGLGAALAMSRLVRGPALRRDRHRSGHLRAGADGLLLVAAVSPAWCRRCGRCGSARWWRCDRSSRSRRRHGDGGSLRRNSGSTA